ncbi:HPP family protein [Glycomyces sp. NPDC021274]|uniref:HPP family protein n=1 Tax=Glycomyces sp. NPDC021274 TaxID=3155120 RepID=UPI0033F6EEE3
MTVLLKSQTARPAWAKVAVPTIAGTTGLLALAALQAATSAAMFALPWVAAMGIIAIAPQAPFVQPRAMLLGQLSAGVVGLAAVAVLGPSLWTAAIAAGLTTAPMLLLKAPHPPATATAAIIGASGPSVWFLLDPILLASAATVLVGWALGRVLPAHRYPTQWW